VRDVIARLIATAALLAEQLFSSDTIILSAGAHLVDVVSACFRARLSLPITLIRSGAYMAHDNGLYARIAVLPNRAPSSF
jgi:hypothetical protein